MTSNLSRRELKRRHATNRWDRAQREMLFVLFTSSEYGPYERLRIFNHMFQNQLASNGISQGLKLTTINSQFREAARGNNAEWRSIVTSSMTDAWRQTETNWSLEIHATAGTLKICASGSMTRRANADSLQNGISSVDSSPESSPANKSKGSSKTLKKRRQRRAAKERAKTQQSSTAPQAIPEVQRRTIQAFAHSQVASAHPRQPAIQPSMQSTMRSVPPSQSLAFRGRPIITPPRTPSSRVLIKQEDGSKILVDHDFAPTLVDNPMIPVQPHEAHPKMSGLLFRFWSAQSRGQNTPEGFVAERFDGVRVCDPPPKSTMLSWTDLLNHVNRGSKASPFISTADNLSWDLCTALKQHANELDTVYISVINAHALPTESIFWVFPFHRELSKGRAFDKGAWLYKGKSEYLIWHVIPAKAMVVTRSLREFVSLCERRPLLDAIFEINELGRRGTNYHRKQEYMRKRRIPLDLCAIRQIARVCVFLGVTPNSPYSHIQHATSELVRGWQLCVTGSRDSGQPKWDHDQWSIAASAFETSLIQYANGEDPVRLDRGAKLKAAFLYGVRDAIADKRVHVEPKLTRDVRLVHHRIALVGLTDPGAIILESLRKAVETIELYRDVQDAGYEWPGSVETRVVEIPEED